MLTNVPQAQRAAARVMVLRHPNAFDAEVYRKEVTRTAFAPGAAVGGLPTLGGVAVLDPEDEAEVNYVLLGEAKVLFAGIYERTEIHDSREAAEQQAVSEAMIEPVTLGAFEPKDSDLIMVMPGAGVVVPYEVTSVINATAIPPYVPKYQLSVQGEMPFDPDLAALQDAKPNL